MKCDELPATGEFGDSPILSGGDASRSSAATGCLKSAAGDRAAGPRRSTLTAERRQTVGELESRAGLIHVAAWISPACYAALAQSLGRHAISLSLQPASPNVRRLEELKLPPGAVAIVEPECLSPDTGCQLVDRLKSAHVGLIAIGSWEGPELGQILRGPFDAVISPTARAVDVAAAIWSVAAYLDGVTNLTNRIGLLERELEGNKWIDQARTVLAGQLQISESEALRRLQHQSRETGKAMAVLARQVLDAAALFNRIATTGSQSGKFVRR